MLIFAFFVVHYRVGSNADYTLLTIERLLKKATDRFVAAMTAIFVKRLE